MHVLVDDDAVRGGPGLQIGAQVNLIGGLPEKLRRVLVAHVGRADDARGRTAVAVPPAQPLGGLPQGWITADNSSGARGEKRENHHHRDDPTKLGHAGCSSRAGSRRLFAASAISAFAMPSMKSVCGSAVCTPRKR